MRGAARRLDARRRWSRAPSPLPPRSPLTTNIIDDDVDDGASPNSHKHLFPYMCFCASIWDNVRHHCHHHHHHHHIQKSKSINTVACLTEVEVWADDASNFSTRWRFYDMIKQVVMGVVVGHKEGEKEVSKHFIDLLRRPL